MKNLLLSLQIVTLALVGYLLYKQFSAKDKAIPRATLPAGASAGSFKVAYFIMDSLDANYDKVKEARKETASKEDAENSKISALEKELQKKAIGYDEKMKANQMTQAEFEAAQRDIAQMKDNLVRQQQSSQQMLMEHNSKKLGEIKKEIEDFLQEYNKDKVYNYIFMYDASSQFLYCDTLYNITKDVVEGLNKRYKERKAR